MPVPIALQLYSVRHEIAKSDFASIVRRVADFGYVGVETAGFPGTTPQAAGQLFEDLGLVVPSIHHFPVPTPDKKGELLDILGALECKRIVSGGGPDNFKTMDDIRRFCQAFDQAAEMFAPHGVTVGIHNHWWEFHKAGDRFIYDHMFDFLSPQVFFQVDTYWVKTAGVDPSEVVGRLGDRAPLLHIKDGPAEQKKPQVAVGEGVMDIPAIVAAGAGFTEWMIVELDECAADMLAAVEKSHHYLTTNALARGR